MKKGAGPADTPALQEVGVAYRDLHEFITRLEKEGELRRVRSEVDPVLEVTEVVQRLGREARRAAIPQGLKPHSSAGSNVGPKGPTHPETGPTPTGLGPALLFESPKGSNPTADQRVWKCAAYVLGVRGERTGRDCRADSGIPKDGDAAGVCRQNQNAAETGGARIVLSEERTNRRLPGSRAEREGREPVRLSNSEMLAAGWWAIHHVSPGVHEESGDREAQRGNVPDADL